ncbi:MAG: GAF domain-containing protein [Candidatus Zixiibacteriota bacterium]|nr:MAG: GAF domain-containing protein [candidate division Zixibacteria bacterium]
MPLIDLVVASVFVIALITVSRFKKYLAGEDRQSYYHVVGGLTVLAVSSLAQIYSGLGAFHQIPFLSDPLFFKLVFCIGVITGLALLINGVSSWAPLSRSYRMYNRERVQRLGLLKKTEQLVRVENRPPAIVEKTLAHLVEGYELTKGAAYLISRKSAGLLYVAGVDTTGADSGSLKGIVFADGAPGVLATDADLDPKRLIERLPGSVDWPDHIIPVMADSYLAGVFLLWGKNVATLSDDDRTGLKLVGDIVGHKIHTDLLKVKNGFYAELRRWQNDLESSLDYRSDFRENMAAVVGCLRQKISLDYFSLTLVHRNGLVHRYTMGETGGLLREIAADFNDSHNVVRRVFDGVRPVIVHDWDGRNDPTVDELMSRMSLSTFAALPVMRGPQVSAVVTFGSKTPHYFDNRRRAYLEAVLSALAALCNEEKHRLEQDSSERRTFAVNNLMSEVARMESIQQVFERATELIAEHLKTTVVRISTVDSRGTFLTSRALQSARPLTGVAPARGAMILSLMPYHQLVIETGRPMMINQESTDKRMTQPEAQQVFGLDVKSALLVPVKIDAATVATVSLADARSWERFQFRQGDIQFVTAVAGVLSLVIPLSGRRKTGSTSDRETRRPEATEGVDPVARNRVKSSLSGIIGSVELLKSKENPTGENLQRCLSIIDRSARRIGEYFAGTPE